MTHQPQHHSPWRALVLRPEPDNHAFCQQVAEQNGEAYGLPTTRIHCLENLMLTPTPHQDSIWIFTSAWAVSCLTKQAPSHYWPIIRQGTVFAIGPKTQKALINLGVEANITTNQSVSSHHTSEQLLSDPIWQSPTTQRIYILKGQGGRTLLPTQLSAKGWSVHTWSLYQRQALPINENALMQWLHQGNPSSTVIFATSVAIMQNLWAPLSTMAQHQLQQCPLVVLSKRMEKAMKQWNWSGRIQISSSPDPSSQLQAAFTCLDLHHPNANPNHPPSDHPNRITQNQTPLTKSITTYLL